MNFRFTKGKVIWSIVIPLIIWILVFIIGSTRALLTNVPTIISSFLSLHDLANIFGLGNISLFVIEVIIVYIIWSIFQKSGRRK